MNDEDKRDMVRSITRTIVSYYDSVREAGGSGRGAPMSDEMIDLLGTLGANHIVFRYEPPFPVPARPKG